MKKFYLLFFIFSVSHFRQSSFAQCTCSDGSTPDSIKYNERFDSIVTTNTTISFPQFDPSIGVLTCFRLTDTVSTIVRYNLENEKAAIPQYQNAVTLEPTRSSWIYELGLIYYNQEDYKNALKCFNSAADAGYSKSNDYYENVGFAQLYTGDTQNGIQTLNELLRRKPNNKELINNIAYAMYETKRYDDALIYFQKLLELNPKDASSLYMAGMTFQKKGEKDKGQKICDKAIEMDPSLAKNRQKKDIPMGL